MYIQGKEPNTWNLADPIQFRSIQEAYDNFKFQNFWVIPLPFILKTSLGFDVLFDDTYEKIYYYLIIENNALLVSKNINKKHNGYESNNFNLKFIQKYKTQQRQQKENQEMRRQQIKEIEEFQRVTDAINEKQRNEQMEVIEKLKQQQKERQEELAMEAAVIPMKREDTQPSEQEGGNYIRHKINKYNFKIKKIEKKNEKIIIR